MKELIKIDDLMSSCKICPRKCGADRYSDVLGFCGQGASITAARAYLHMWEEPCISGTNGSGTVFFSGCNMRCVFCQNSEIASGDVAKEISTERLSEIFLELQEQKASNINLVTPTHFVPQIIPAIVRAKDQGLTIPFVYNTSGYENVDTLKMLDGLIDIYLPDCKYFSDDVALRYSKAPKYFETAIAAIDEMVRQVGEPVFVDNDKQFSADGYNNLMEDADDDYEGPLMKKGVIIRHLVIPSQIRNSFVIVDKLLERYGNKVYLSIMNQFTPHGDLAAFPELLTPVSDEDYEALIDFAIDHGIENGFFQGSGTDSESFIPAFDFRGL